MKENYQKAVLALIQAGETPESVIVGLKSALAAHGHDALLSGILSSVLRVLEAKGQTSSTVTLAKSSDSDKYQTAISAALESLSATDKPTYVVDDTIIGGFIAEANNRIINNSYKQHLVGLYRKLTH